MRGVWLVLRWSLGTCRSRASRNVSNPMAGSGTQQARSSLCGESRRGGEKPRGRNGIWRLVSLDREKLRLLGVDAHWVCQWRGEYTARRGDVRWSGFTRLRRTSAGREAPVGWPRPRRSTSCASRCTGGDEPGTPRGSGPATVQGRGGAQGRPITCCLVSCGVKRVSQ